MMDLYSGRRAVIKSEEKRWAKEFEERNGRAPTGRERRAARQHFSYRTRKAKSGEAELRASAVSRWVKGMADKIGKTHEDVLKAVFPAERRTVADFLRLQRKDAEAAERATYDRKAIAAAALKEVAAARSHDGHWSPFHMAMEVDRALPGDLGLRPEDVEALQTSIAEEALEAPELTCLSADDPVADAPAEFRRASDGKSVLTKRERRRYALTETLEKERRLLALPLRCGGAAMAADVAAAEVAARTQVVDPADPSKVIRPGLKPDQATIVEGVLASRRAVDLLVGPAGAGKSRLVATLPELWPGQVFGLATSNAAAHVLEGEGLKRSRNIELWFRIQERLAAGLPKGGDEAFRLKKGCLIVVDEGSMVGTTDLLRICDLVSAAGGKVLITGDHHQLGAIKEPGSFRSLVTNREVLQAGAVFELVEVARFVNEWERDASLELRDGNTEVLDLYERHGRIEGGTPEEMVTMAVEDHLVARGRNEDSMVVVGTNEMRADLAMRIRTELVAAGVVSNKVTLKLADSTLVGVGDLVQVRQNDHRIIDPATQRAISNRDTYEVLAIDDGALVVRRRGQHKSFKLPADYVRDFVELGYVSTVTSAQGRTCDRCHVLVDLQATAEWLYVAMTRGRHSNRAYVVTVAPEVDSLAADKSEPREAKDVLVDVMGRTTAAVGASEYMARDYEEVHSLARLHQIWVELKLAEADKADRQAAAKAFGPGVANLVEGDEAAPAFWGAVIDARQRGYDVEAMLSKIVNRRELETARSMAMVLQWRIQRYMEERAPGVVPDFSALDAERMEATTYIERTPEPEGLATPNLGGNSDRLAYARRVAIEMDRRVEVLVQRALEALTDSPGTPDALEAWKARMRPVLAYKEAHGITSDLDGPDPIGPAPSRRVDPERYRSWQLADDALGNPDRSHDINRLSDSELRRAIAAWDTRYHAEAPDDVAQELAEARRDLRRNASSHRRVVLAASASAPRLSQQVEDLEAEVKRLDRMQDVRDAFMNDVQNAAMREAAKTARRELQARHPEVRPSELFRPQPEEVSARRRGPEPKQKERAPSLADGSTRTTDMGIGL